MKPEQWLAVRKDGLSYLECLYAAVSEPKLVSEVDRLCGTNLMFRGSGIELEIDRVTGKLDHDLEIFCDFVWECIFIRVPLTKTEPNEKNTTSNPIH